MRTVIFFRDSIGECPVEKFLGDLSAKEAQKVTWALNLIEQVERVPTLYLKKLINTDDIWEVRIQFGSRIFRILGFFDAHCFIATNGFCKKSQKTPVNEIILAEKRKAEYNRRRGE